MKTTKALFGILTTMAALAIQVQAQSSLTNGLVGYWPFNGNANDESGNGNNGVVYGATLIADRFGNPNSAYSFDGVADYVRMAAAPSLNITGDLTISAWIRTTSSGALDDRIIFSDMLQISPADGYSLWLVNGKGHFMSGGLSLNGNTPVNMNLWTHVAVALSGTTATAYVNGILDSTGTVGVPTSSSVDPTIGASYTPYYFFNGSIDDVRVYNRALSYSEILALSTIPEPSTSMLFSAGAISLLAYVWRRRTAVYIALNRN